MTGLPMTCRYRRGEGLLAVAPTRVVLTSSTAHAPLLEELLDESLAGAEVLSAIPGRSSDGAEWAVLLQVEGARRMFLRGAVQVELVTDAGSARLSGSTLVDWSEHGLPDDGACSVRWSLGWLDRDDSDDPGLPLSAGLALAGTVTISVGPAAVSGKDGAAIGASHLEPGTAVPVAVLPAVDAGLVPAAAAAAPAGEPATDPSHTLAFEGAQAVESQGGAGTPVLPVEEVGARLPEPEVDELHDALASLVWGHTIDRSVHEAAGEGHPDDLPAARSAGPGPVTAQPPTATPVPAAPAAGPGPQAVVSGTSEPVEPVPGPGETSSLISSVSWGGGSGVGGGAPLPPAVAVPPAAVVGSRPVPPVREAPSSPAPVAEDLEDLSLTAVRPKAPAPATAVPDELTDTVLAVPCPSGHANPPGVGRCRSCGLAVAPGDPSPMARPPLGRLRLSTGDVVLLDRGALLGRNPALAAGREGPRPHLVMLGADVSDVSRTHLEIVLDEWSVLVKDLSSNGTLLEEPEREPVQLTPRQAHPLLPGSRLVLADGVWIELESLS